MGGRRGDAFWQQFKLQAVLTGVPAFVCRPRSRTLEGASPTDEGRLCNRHPERVRNYHEAGEEEEARVQDLARPDARVCHACVLDAYLWEDIDDFPELGVCDYCGQSSSETVSLEAVAEVVFSTIGSFHSTLEESGAYSEDGEWNLPVRDIGEVAWPFLWDSVGTDLMAPLLRYIEDRDDTPYGWVDRADMWARRFDLERADWDRFAGTTRTSTTTLDQYMSSIDPRVRKLMKTVFGIVRDSGLIKTGAPPPLWRCRPAETGTDFTTAAQLGTPPAGCGGPNRMTAAGDSVFYASTSQRGAVIEIAQGHQGKTLEVWAGQFTASRHVRYLDTFDIPQDPSPYAPDAVEKSDALAFLRQFAKSVSLPKPEPLPSEHSHYLPTQVFTAFLRGVPKSQRPEAIRYASSLDEMSENWVIFVGQDDCVDGVASSNELQLILTPNSPEKLGSHNVERLV